MSDTNNVDVSKLTTEQIAELFNNPNVLNMAIMKAKNAGLVQEPTRNVEPPKPAKFEEKAPEMPSIEEGDSSADVAKKFADYTKKLADFHNKQREWDKKEINDSLKNRDIEAQRRVVSDFANDPKRIKHFQNPEIYRDIERMFNTGDTIDKAYEKALKLHDITEETSNDSEGKKSDQPANISASDNSAPRPSDVKPRNSESSGGDNGSSSKGSMDVGGAAKRALASLITNNPNAKADLGV